MKLSPRTQRILTTVLVVVAAALGLTVDLNGDSPPASPAPAPTATPSSSVAIDGPDADANRDDTLKLDPAARDVLRQATANPERFDLAGDLRGPDTKPAGVPEGPLAAQEWPGCKTAFVRAFSARTSPVKAIALHYTAGLNRPGWSDLDGLTAFSNNTANQVSWHFSIDREGHCAYNVPTNQKAWTIAGLNSQTINFEIVGSGSEPDYAGTAGLKKLRQVVLRIHRLYPGIPVRLGATDGHCNVTRPGIITHWMGGACSGGHIDIKPYSIEAVIKRLAATAKPTATASNKVLCRKLQWWRKHGRPGGKARANAIARRKLLATHGLRCTSKGKVVAA